MGLSFASCYSIYLKIIMTFYPTYFGQILANIRKDIKAFLLSFRIWPLEWAEAFLPKVIMLSLLNKIVNCDSCRKMIHKRSNLAYKV